MTRTLLREVEFRECKLLGLSFSNCDQFLFSIKVENCNVDLSSFFKLKLKKTTFKNSSMHEVDFTEADLTQAIFDNCDLTDAIFINSNLEKADLSSGYNYSIDPEINKMKKAKFTWPGVVGLLDKYDIDID